MLAAAIVVFREVLEAALIIGIVLAATTGVVGSRRWVAGGIVGGIAGALLAALFAGTIAASLEGSGQEMFNAGILLAAVAMLGWHNVWMARHGREIAAQMKAVGAAVSAGSRPLAALAMIVGLAVLREGSETALFLYGIAVADTGGLTALLGGGALGLAAGAAVGFALYLGLLRISSRYLFATTSAMVALLAAGMASQAVSFLAAGGAIDSMGTVLWDSSWLLTENGIVGQVLHTLIGYTAQPTSLQLAAYAATLLAIAFFMRVLGRAPGNVRAPATSR